MGSFDLYPVEHAESGTCPIRPLQYPSVWTIYEFTMIASNLSPLAPFLLINDDEKEPQNTKQKTFVQVIFSFSLFLFMTFY